MQNSPFLPQRLPKPLPVLAAPTHGRDGQLERVWMISRMVDAPKVVTNNISSNRARRSLTLLMWPTPLPMCYFQVYPRNVLPEPRLTYDIIQLLSIANSTITNTVEMAACTADDMFGRSLFQTFVNRVQFSTAHTFTPAFERDSATVCQYPQSVMQFKHNWQGEFYYQMKFKERPVKFKDFQGRFLAALS